MAKLDVSGLEARGLFLLQQSVTQARQAAAAAAAQAADAENDAEQQLRGLRQSDRLPEGVGILALQINQQTDEVTYPDPEPPTDGES